MNSYLVSHSSIKIRGTMIMLIALPFVLSAVYKVFIGGESSWVISSGDRNITALYGIAYPALNEYAGFNNSIFLYTNAYADFQLAMLSGKDVLPTTMPQQATPYGFNLLLLSNTSAAALDVPTPEHISSLQSGLIEQEKLSISTSVNAFVATHNTSLEMDRENDTFWEETFAYNRNGFKGMTSFELFDQANDAIGFLPEVPNQHESAACLLGIYPGSDTFWSDYYNSTTSHDSLLFRNYSMMFSVTRTRCNATWVLKKTSIQLASGSCADRKLDKITVATDIFEDSLLNPYPLDALPVFVHTIGDIEQFKPDNPWRMSTYVSSVVMSYWARAVFMFPLMTKKKFTDVLYSPPSEAIISTRATLKASGALYFILALQPALGILALVAGLILHKTPIGTGFGVVSILAGVDTETLDELEGATLSGKPIEPIRLDVNINSTPHANRVKYSLVASKDRRGDRNDFKLQRGKIYV